MQGVEKWSWDYHKSSFGSLVSSWPTSQPTNGFPMESLYVWKVLTFNLQIVSILKEELLEKKLSIQENKGICYTIQII